MTQLVPVKQSARRLTRRRVVGQRDHQAMEQRRMQAADLFEHGMIPAEIARRAGVLVYEPDGSDAHLVFQLRPGAYNDETLIDFLAEVHQHEEQRSIILIWDGLPSHRSRHMLDWVATQRDWLSIEPLPGYAPDLNPIEQVWGNVKSQELANLCADTIGEVSEAAEDGLDRISSDAPLCFAFLRHSGLRL